MELLITIIIIIIITIIIIIIIIILIIIITIIIILSKIVQFSGYIQCMGYTLQRVHGGVVSNEYYMGLLFGASVFPSRHCYVCSEGYAG